MTQRKYCQYFKSRSAHTAIMKGNLVGRFKKWGRGAHRNIRAEDNVEAVRRSIEMIHQSHLVVVPGNWNRNFEVGSYCLFSMYKWILSHIRNGQLRCIHTKYKLYITKLLCGSPSKCFRLHEPGWTRKNMQLYIYRETVYVFRIFRRRYTKN